MLQYNVAVFSLNKYISALFSNCFHIWMMRLKRPKTVNGIRNGMEYRSRSFVSKSLLKHTESH